MKQVANQINIGIISPTSKKIHAKEIITLWGHIHLQIDNEEFRIGPPFGLLLIASLEILLPEINRIKQKAGMYEIPLVGEGPSLWLHSKKSPLGMLLQITYQSKATKTLLFEDFIQAFIKGSLSFLQQLQDFVPLPHWSYSIKELYQHVSSFYEWSKAKKEQASPSDKARKTEKQNVGPKASAK